MTRAFPGAMAARNRGFTLLELLVAMFIAAVIFAMGYGAINQAVKNRVELQEQQAKLLELQTAMRTIEQDFVQLAQRPIREPIGGGNTYQSALVSNTTNTSTTTALGGNNGTPATTSTTGAPPLVALTRSGWNNPTGVQRPTLQRVAYFFENGTLRREYWTVLDPTQSSPAVRRDVLTHLKSVSLRFLDQGSAQLQTGGAGQPQAQAQNWNWGPIWPPVNHAGQDNRRYRPIAVEITLDTEDWGKVVRIIEVAG